MGLPKSTSNCDDLSDFIESSLAGELQCWEFDFTFSGRLELISVVMVDFGLICEV